MKHESKGFSMVELMITVMIIGILSAVAIPSYNNYIHKSRLTEIVGLVHGVAMLVGDQFYLNNNAVPGHASGGPDTSTFAQTINNEECVNIETNTAVGNCNYAAGVGATNATITILLQNMSAAINGKSMTFSIDVSGLGALMTCDYSALPSSVQPGCN